MSLAAKLPAWMYNRPLFFRKTRIETRRRFEAANLRAASHVGVFIRYDALLSTPSLMKLRTIRRAYQGISAELMRLEWRWP